MRKTVFTALVLGLTACNSQIYVQDGVTDGDTFYLADRAFMDNDPVLQSWVAYSLSRSTCQLEIGGPNPARVSDYGCEFSARSLMLDTWQEKTEADPSISDRYFDDLVRVREAGYLDEYVVRYFGSAQWQVPAEVDVTSFRAWQSTHLRNHRPQTRLVGSWNFADRR